MLYICNNPLGEFMGLSIYNKSEDVSVNASLNIKAVVPTIILDHGPPITK